MWRTCGRNPDAAASQLRDAGQAAADTNGSLGIGIDIRACVVTDADPDEGSLVHGRRQFVDPAASRHQVAAGENVVSAKATLRVHPMSVQR